MCVFRKHIKPSIFENIFPRIEKTVNTFSIFEKIFLKIINYSVPLGHTSKTHFVLTMVYIPIGSNIIVSLSKPSVYLYIDKWLFFLFPTYHTQEFIEMKETDDKGMSVRFRKK